MAGIYIHIPFCHSRCPYCNFFATASKKDIPGFSKHLNRELHQRREFLGNQPVKTIYLGGGTPSLIHPREIERVLNVIDSLFHVDDDVEVTIEVNPEDVSKENCRLWEKAGINRMSIGVQSFRDEDLQFLKRIHDSRKALNGIRTAIGNGFENLSVDLIYGIPGQSDEDWMLNLNTVFSLRLKHFSAYSLTVEPGTPLHLMVDKKKLPDVDEEQAQRQFHILREAAAKQGYDHYEVSNFALPGEYSRHNTSYWQGKPYLGIGPSAHSFNGKERSWNPSSMQAYIKALDENSLPSGKEVLSGTQRFNEFMMLGLRTMWGCEIQEIRTRFGQKVLDHVSSIAEGFIDKGWIEKSDITLKLSPEGLFMADGIAAAFFMEDENTRDN